MVEGATSWAGDLAARLALVCGNRLVVRFGCLLTAGEDRLTGVPEWRIELLVFPARPLLVVFPYEVDVGPIEECALSGVPQVWLCRIEEREIETLSEPIAGRFRRRSLILPGEKVELTGMPGIVLAPLPSEG